MSDQARDYQALSLDLIRAKFNEGFRKVLLWLATGAGKTFVFSMMLKTAQESGLPTMVIVRGRKLVDQASKRLFREGVDHGVMMAGHWNYKPMASCQVCSIDTLISRQIFPDAALIIIDEADLFTPDTRASEFLSHEKYLQSFIVPVTATPWVREGLAHIADTIVHPITMEQLIDAGWLCGFKYYAPCTPDLSSVEVSKLTDDYKADQLLAVMSDLTGNVIEHWIRLAKDRPTFLFAANVKHSKLLAQRFCEAGVPAEHCDANSTDRERESAYGRLEYGATRIICNVGIAGRGVDVPRVSCIVMARPTRQRNLFIQQAGRGTRIFEDKTECLLLDHAGNIARHGFPTDEPDVELEGEPKTERKPRETKFCPNCNFLAFRGPVCPECGVRPPERTVELQESDELLVEIKPKLDPIKERIKELRAQRNGKSMTWVYYHLEKEFGSDAVAHYKPKYLTDPFSQSLFNRGVRNGRNKRARQSTEERKEKREVAGN